ncbi:hypothetical protein GCM10009804_71040 [Kribbella hippodromi]|uniref:AAA domain-containing protein n=1 Tax=Kribbella hippodromi TaxID=434347 RepID=A0ABP4QCB7_9ACTN
MAELVLIVGLPGAGKSRWARKVEADRKALRLTPDEWMHALFGAGDATAGAGSSNPNSSGALRPEH